MSEKELNSYRFGSGEDPTDEMLEAIMNAARIEAVKRAHEAEISFEEDYKHQYSELYAKWHFRINNAINGVY